MKLFNRKALLAMLMAILLVLGTCLTACKPSDPVKYEQMIEKDAAKEFASDFADAYDEYLSAANKNTEKVSSKYDIDLEISSAALSLIELAASASEMELDLSWLSNISLGGEAYMDADLITSSLVLGLGDSDLVGLDVILDSKSGEAIIGLPEILKKYISVDFAKAIEMSGAELNMASTAVDFSKLPEGKTLEKLINKYVGILVDGIKTVERAEGTASANGVEVSCEVLTITVTEADAMAIVKELLTEVRNDNDVKAVLIAFVDFVRENAAQLGVEVDMEIPTGAEVYADMCDGIDEVLADLEETTVEEDAEDAENLIIKNYVNKKDEIIGRTVIFGEEEMLSYVYAENKDDFGFVLTAEGNEVIRGKGTTGKKLNGVFEIVTEENEIGLVLTVTDLDLDKMEKDGYINGIFDIRLGEGATYSDDMAATLFANYSIRVEIQQKDLNTANIAFGLVDSDGAYFLKFAMAVSKGSGKPLDRPAAADVIEIPLEEMDEETSQTLAMDLLTSIDVDEIVARLEASPIPTEYVELIEQYLAYIDLIKAMQQ